MKNIVGKTTGLKPSQRQRLEKLLTRRIDPHASVTPELARSLTELSDETARQVGVLIDRSGRVVDVMVGDAVRLYLPDIGRARAGAARLRGLRLVVTELTSRERDVVVRPDLLTDLQKLQLDLVVVLEVLTLGHVGRVATAQLLPPNPQGEHVRILHARQVQDLDDDFIAFVTALEQELTRKVEETRDAERLDLPGERAVLVGVYTRPRAEAQRSMDELHQLARAAGARVVESILQLRKELDPRTVLGKGKLEEVCLSTLHQGADLLIFDADLSPSQLKHITDATDLKVLDRTMLILDIFAQRARSLDGKLQVELAQLKYSLPRLAARQTGLSRLTGGIGGRGPGETRLEIDRRRAKDRMSRLEREIEGLSRRRQLRRKQRNERGLPVVSIVGYTNAGKSTLLNALTHSEVHVEDVLFATLDPTSRRLRFPREREVIITDTVGFIRDLPEDLVNAFRATLEELSDASLLWHVVDVSDPNLVEHVASVDRTLEALGLAGKPRLVVLNKADLTSELDSAVRARGLDALVISARQQKGFERLLNRSAEILWQEEVLVSDSKWALEPEVILRPPTLEDFAHLFNDS
ncbi:MAG: GTPase HflX [Pseudomonadota bacterium]